MSINAEAVGLIGSEFTYIDITFCMPESTLSLSFIEIPLSFIVGTINPVLQTVPVSDVVFVIHFSDKLLLLLSQVRNLLHLSSITRVVWEDVHVYILQSLIIFEVLFDLVHRFHLNFTGCRALPHCWVFDLTFPYVI